MDEIKIGMVYPDTGTLASVFIEARSGVTARVAQENAAGGVNGRKVTIEWRDDESGPLTNLAVARDLVERVGVFGLIETTAVASGSADYLDSAGIPVAGIVAEPIWSLHRNMFAFSNPYTEGPSVTTFGLYAKQSGGTRALVLRRGLSEPSQIITEKLAASLASQGISVVVATDDFRTGFDPARIARKILQEKADVIVSATSGTVLASVLQAAHAAGAPIKAAFGPDGYDARLPQQYGSSIADMSVYISQTPFELDSPALNAYHDAMARYAPELESPDQSGAIQSYVVADILLRGLQVAGDCPSRPAFIKALREVKDYDAGRLMPAPIDMEKSFGRLSNCYYFVRVNKAGTGYDVVPGGSGHDGKQWCGEYLAPA